MMFILKRMRGGLLYLLHPAIMRNADLNHIITRSLLYAIDVRAVEDCYLEFDTPL